MNPEPYVGEFPAAWLGYGRLSHGGIGVRICRQCEGADVALSEARPMEIIYTLCPCHAAQLISQQTEGSQTI